MSFFSKFASSLSEDSSASNGVVGIDIGSSSIKVVEITDKKDVITLSTYGEIQLGPYASKPIGDSVTLDSTQEQEALVDVIRESAVRAKNAVFAMPLSSSFVTNVSIDAEADVDLGALVRVEARKVIPASLSEVTLDWAEVEGTNKDKKSTKKDILIASIQNVALERFNALMGAAGLNKPPTEIECFSSIRGLFDTDEENVAIIDLGAVSSKLYLARKGLLMRMHRIRAGGTLATKAIADAKGIKFDEAEDIKLNLKRDSSDFAQLKKAHDDSYGRAFREFGQVIREYESKTGQSLEAIYLSGGGALFPGIELLLREALGREVVLANPFSKVAYPAFMEDNMHNIGPSFSVALGAALRAFE